jgi:GNAT superfamily N-acetyltransferase
MENKWDLLPLEKKHERQHFDCGIEMLNVFIKTLASQHQEKNFSRTTVAVLHKEHTVKGYYSLSNGSVDLSILPEHERKRLPRHPVPVVTLGRLAVCKSSQKQGLGEILLLDALKKAHRINSDIGVYAVEVDAINEAAVSFYLAYGFEQLVDDKKHLYLSMKSINKIFNKKSK